MKNYNDRLFQKKEKPNAHLIEPDKCDETCIKFSYCPKPEGCKIRLRQAQREKQRKEMERRWINL